MKKMLVALAMVLMASSAAFADEGSSKSAFETFSGIQQLHDLSAQDKLLSGGVGPKSNQPNSQPPPQYNQGLKVNVG